MVDESVTWGLCDFYFSQWVLFCRKKKCGTSASLRFLNELHDLHLHYVLIPNSGYDLHKTETHLLKMEHKKNRIRIDAISTMSSLDAQDNPYVQLSPASASPNGKNKTWEVLDRCGKRFENNTRSIKAVADNVWNHLKLSSSVTDAAVVRLCLGTKLLTEGGYEKVFQQTFGFVDGDKYLDSFACYLSTSTGPVNGTLYISTKRVAFYSEFPLCHYPSPGQPQWIHYKVVIAVDQLRKINVSSNLKDPSQKYIQIIAKDFHEFWFMGFISYNTALKTLTNALQRSRA